MAGIGFALRRLLARDTYTGVLQAYAYASVIGSGPWVLSIVGILAIGVMSSAAVPAHLVGQFQTSVTYLIVSSLIVTGPLQLGFTRYIADLLYAKREALVVPSFQGMLCVVSALAGVVGLTLLVAFFRDVGVAYQLLMFTGFVLLSNIWVATIFLSGLKQYHALLALYALGYGITVGAALLLQRLGLEGLLLGFVLGQAVLFIGMLALVLRSYPLGPLVDFGFARPGAMYPSLLAVGLAFNLGLWIDKFIFWFTPSTSEPVIGPLRASVIYDLPIFLAYLSILPGMAVFLVRIETDFVEAYRQFYDAVREGARLEQIETARDQMVASVRRGLFEIVKIQSIAALVVFAAGPALLDWAGIPQLYLPLLYVDVIAAGMQVVLLGVLNVFFYLDKRRTVLALTAAFLVLNAIFTWASIYLGAPYFGYGFALAVLASLLAGFVALDQKLDSLEYETFMLQ